MEERPISSRMQELLQRAADERQADQNRHGETVEWLRSHVDELATNVVGGTERLTEKIDATFALTASTVEILQRLADRVDSLERALDDITMQLGSISWRVEEVRDGEGRLADRIDESALALAEAMFANARRAQPPVDAPSLQPPFVDPIGDAEPAVDSSPDSADANAPDADLIQHNGLPAEEDERPLPGYAATAARFEPPGTPAPGEPAGKADRDEPSLPAQPPQPMEPAAPEPADRLYANVVDLPSHGREPAATPRPGDEVASGRPLWGPSGDFLGSRTPAATAADTQTTVFEFPTEGSDQPPADREAEQDDAQDFFDRWGPRRDEPVAEAPDDPPTAESPVPEEGRSPGRGLNGPPTGQRFLREVSAARESQQAARAVETPAAEARATDDTVPPEWFASYFRDDTRSGLNEAKPPGPAPLPGGGRPAPGSA